MPVEIAGHEVPTPAVVGVAVVGAGLLYIYMRDRSAAAAAAAQAPIAAPADTSGGGGGSGGGVSSDMLTAFQAQEQQDIKSLQDALSSQASAFQQQLQQQAQANQQALDQQSSSFQSQLSAMQTQETSALQALQEALAKLEAQGSGPGPGAGGGGGDGGGAGGGNQSSFSFNLPSVYYHSSNFGNEWGFGGNQYGPGRPAMEGLSAGAVLGDLGGLVLPVAYQPNHDSRVMGNFSTGPGFSGWSWVMSRTYDIAKQNGQLNNQAYVQQVLWTQLARLKQDAINNGWNLNNLGWDLSKVPAYYATSYTPGQVDLRGYTGPGSNYSPGGSTQTEGQQTGQSTQAVKTVYPPTH